MKKKKKSKAVVVWSSNLYNEEANRQLSDHRPGHRQFHERLHTDVLQTYHLISYIKTPYYFTLRKAHICTYSHILILTLALEKQGRIRHLGTLAPFYAPFN